MFIKSLPVQSWLCVRCWSVYLVLLARALAVLSERLQRLSDQVDV